MKFLHGLLFCCVTSFVYAHTARILIIYKASNQFTIEELAQKIDAHILQIDAAVEETIAQKLKEEIIQLDRTEDNHRIIIDSSKLAAKNVKKKIGRLSWRVGYDYLIISKKTLEQAVDAIADREKTLPLTDEALPRINEIVAGRLYDILMRVDALFQEHNILYWGTCGTLLGAVRHSGLIPWDDDIDLAMLAHDVPKLLALKEVLHQKGLDICMHSNGWYKIFALDGDLVEVSAEFAPYFRGQTHYTWRYPSVDIFPMHIAADGSIRYVKKNVADSWGSTHYFYAQEILSPLVYMPFGPTHLPIPRNFIDIVARMYGEDWNDITYVEYDHQKEAWRTKIKVKLTDRSTIPYILPIN
jgi:lipopolysaccharide cholinephosphotransferase